ncbi:MAG: hypothetical protein ACFFC6_10985, partial [Promethearchaeota archaeon]
MNYFRRISSLIIILLLFMNIVAIFVIADTTRPPKSMVFLDQVSNDQNSKLSYNAPPNRIGIEKISGNTTLKTDKDSYAPGEWVEITAESITAEMNGSLEWQLESPISEVTFDFESNFQDIFEDRTFDDINIPDWTNEGFHTIEATSGYLNLTEVSDPDTTGVEAYYNSSSLESGFYSISFDYFSQGENLLLNPGFEEAIVSEWDFDPSFVERILDPNNASEGNYYASVNGTEGYLLNQTVLVTEGIHDIILVVKATGVSGDNSWDVRLESYNSTSTSYTGYKTSSSSIDAIPDDKGYVTQILKWQTPENTTKLKVVFRGRDSGVDDYYTGWIDDFYLYEIPPALKFGYWYENPDTKDSEWRYESLTTGTHEWENATFKKSLGQNNSKTFRFILPDDNSLANNATSYWFIDNFRVDLRTVPKEEMGPIVNHKDTFQGRINSTWLHRGFREELYSEYTVKVESPENATTPSDCLATIQVQLPEHQVYFGSWIFVFKIHQIKEGSGDPLEIKTINMSFTVEEPMDYVVQDIYMLRGSTNRTQGESQYIFTEYFEKESDIEAFSPGDNVTILGYLEANSTPDEWYSLNYLKINPVDPDNPTSVEFQWEGFPWTDKTYGYVEYDPKGETILDGNFTSPFDNAKTMALNFQIPNRGIYGNFSANLTITIEGTNEKSDGEGGDPLTVKIPLNLPPVKYKVNIIEENLPATNYYITDYLEGNITLEFHNYNETLESDYPNRNISINLTIPMKDLELTIFLDDQGQTPSEIDISQRFHYHYIGNSVLWSDEVDPSLKHGNYLFRIRWNAPYDLGVLDQDILLSHSIQVRGSPIVVPAEESTGLNQGDQKTINFTVHIDNATGKLIKGLDLIGVVDNNLSYGKLVIYEEEGVYKINLDIERDAEAREYIISIIIPGRSEAIGDVKYTVIEVPITTETPLTPIDIIINYGGFVFFILVSVGAIGALYWANKSLK